MAILSSPVAAGGKHELWHGGPEDLVGLVNSWRARVGERRWQDTRLGLMVVVTASAQNVKGLIQWCAGEDWTTSFLWGGNKIALI